MIDAFPPRMNSTEKCYGFRSFAATAAGRCARLSILFISLGNHSTQFDASQRDFHDL